MPTEESEQKTGNGKEKAGNAKLRAEKNEESYDFQDSMIFDDPMYKPMPFLIDSRITAEDEFKITESLNHQEPVAYVSEFEVDHQQVRASWNEEQMEKVGPSTQHNSKDDVSCDQPDVKEDEPSQEYKCWKNAMEIEVGLEHETISVTQATELSFVPHLPQDSEESQAKLPKIKKSIRELKKGIRAYKNSDEFRGRKDCQKRLSMSRFVRKNYIPQSRIVELKMNLILYRQLYNEKLLKSVIRKLDSKGSK